MGISEIISGLSDTSKPIAVIASAIAIFCVTWICWRARSVQPIVRRLWLWVVGGASVTTPEIQKALVAEASLQQFRVETGVQCRTLGQAKKVVEWAEKHDESLSDIGWIGFAFNFEKCELKNPGSLFFAVFLSILSFFFGLLMAACLSVAESKSAFLTFKDSGTHFGIDTKEAQHFFDKPIGREECKKISSDEIMSEDFERRTGFSAAEAKDICTLFNDEKFNSYLNNEIDKQRIIFLYFSAGVFFYFLIVVFALHKDLSMRRMYKRVALTRELLSSS